MDQSLSPTDDATDPQARACHAVRAWLESTGQVDADPDTIDEVAVHIETCAACRAALDAIYPEHALPPLAERLSSEAAALFSQIQGDAQTEAEVAAWLFLESRHADEPSHDAPRRSCKVAVLAESRRRPQPIAIDNGARDQFAGQFFPGQVLCGGAGRYVIKSRKKASDCSETYEAVVQEYLAGSDVQAQSRVIIRIPRVTAEMSNEGAAARLVLLANLLRATMMTQRRLVGSEHVAQLLDQGEYDHRLHAVTSPSTFAVYRFVDGPDLVCYMNERHGEPFRGVACARDFFAWARKLTLALLDIHQRLALHGDICPRNIIVSPDGDRPVFVDLGQSLFTRAMNDVEGPRTSPYSATDEARTPSADLFSLGGVLYFLATGAEPHGLGHIGDIELLKQQVERTIRDVNPRLFEDEAGVVDIIARCLRGKGRVQVASQLLQDIEMFEPTTVTRSLASQVGDLRGVSEELEAAGNTLFQWVAGIRLRRLAETFRDMNRGVLDLSGDAKDICSAACALNSALSQGDEFIATSLPQFWYPGNMGINGRFLTTTRMAASRNVRIRRILILDTNLDDEYLDQIVAAQRKVAVDLKHPANYSVSYVLMTPHQRRQFIRDGLHFGVFERPGESIAMFPVYSDEGKLVTLRFRTDDTLVQGLRGIFHALLASAKPLADLQLPARPRAATVM